MQDWKHEVLIIGNGFDLQNNLNTDYNSFFLFLKEKVEKELDPFLIEKNKNNFFVNFFLTTEDCFENWFDLEKELAKLIETIVCFLSLYPVHNLITVDSTKEFAYFSFRIPQGIREKRIFYNNKFIKWKYLSRVPITQERKSDGNLIAYINTQELKIKLDLLETPQGGLEFKKRILQDLVNDFQEFEKYFIEYLETVINPQINKLQKKKLEDCTDETGVITKVITYNYTDTPLKLFGLKKEDVFFIHGNIKEKIIFGIDKSTMNGEIFENIDEELKPYLQHFYKDAERRLLYQKQGINLNSFIGDSMKFHIYGHSLNTQDYESLRQIILRNSDQELIIYYKEKPNEENKILQQLYGLYKDEKEVHRLMDDKKIKIKNSKEFKM